ncbi:MAG: hypothetical protein QM802_18500 [Agriterribacter sp.]
MQQESTITLPYAEFGLIIRTDFSKESKWEIICNEINDSGNMFETYALFINDIKFQNLDEEKLPKFDSNNSLHTFILLVDEICSSHADHPLKYIDLADNFGSYFRIIPSEVWGVTASLSVANLDFSEYVRHLDNDGIFRGFPIVH